MKPENIIKHIAENFHGVVPKSSWGETSLFYNPGKALPNGVYFCTIKEKNGENDKSSELDRAGIFRVSIGINKSSYEKLFGLKPPRPAKGGIINTGHDFTALNTLMPHPIYGWMNWVQILNPNEAAFTEILPLIEEAYASAVVKFNKKILTSR
ncbi:hypothetical protein DDM87_17775 [Vibrio cholerae]|jgi:hypothetical protein|nr:hypothetical protein [Vibrio cholerae]